MRLSLGHVPDELGAAAERDVPAAARVLRESRGHLVARFRSPRIDRLRQSCVHLAALRSARVRVLGVHAGRGASLVLRRRTVAARRYRRARLARRTRLDARVLGQRTAGQSKGHTEDQS